MERVKKTPQVMRHELPQGTSAVEVQVSLMETSQNTIFFLPPILKPTRNYSHTYNQMLQSATFREYGEGSNSSHSLLFLRPRTPEPLCSLGDTGRAGAAPRKPEKELPTCVLQKEGAHWASLLLLMDPTSSQTHLVLSLPSLLNVWLLTFSASTIRAFL